MFKCGDSYLILVSIASSEFAFWSIFASTLASRALFSCLIVDTGAPSVAVILLLFCFAKVMAAS